MVKRVFEEIPVNISAYVEMFLRFIFYIWFIPGDMSTIECLHICLFCEEHFVKLISFYTQLGSSCNSSLY